MPRKEYAMIEDIQEIMNQMKNELVNKIMVVMDKIDAMEKRIDASEARIQDKIDMVEKRIDASVTNIEQRVSEVEKMSTENKAGTLKELYEMDEKRSNVVVFGIPEPVGSGEASPRDNDTKEVDSIFLAVKSMRAR